MILTDTPDKMREQVIEALSTLHVYINSKLFFTEELSVAWKCGSAFLHSAILTVLTNLNPSSNKISLHYIIEALQIHFYKTTDRDALDNFIRCPNHVCFKFIRFSLVEK